MNTTLRPRVIFTGIQALRGIAALLVVLHHTLEELAYSIPQNALIETVTRAGACGVDLFFVISGFIMANSTSSLVKKKTGAAATTFLKNRIVRIVPLYWILSAFVVVLHSTGFLYKTKIITFADTMRSIFFLPTENLLIGVGWTLNYEFTFYIAFTIAILARERIGICLASTLILLLVFMIAHFIPSSTLAAHFGNPIIFEFSYGMIIAKMTKSTSIRRRTLMQIVMIAATIILYSSYKENSSSTNGLNASYRFLVWGVPSAVIVYAFTKISDSLGIFNSIGDSSYSLYLIHSFVMTALALFIRLYPPIGVFSLIIYGSLAVFLSYLFSVVSLLLIEQKLDQILKTKFLNYRFHSGVG